MSDDEEILVEDSPLHKHLKDLGYEVSTETPTKQSPVVSTPPPSYKVEASVKTTPTDALEEVLILRAANLIFEEDLDHIDRIFAAHSIAKNESMTALFRGKSCLLVLAIGLLLFLYVGAIAFLIVSSYFAYRITDFLWTKHKRMIYLKKLMSLMQKNCSLCIDIIKFLSENENMLKRRFDDGNRPRALKDVNELKDTFINVLHDINRTLADATVSLIRRVTLLKDLEDPESYVSFHMNTYEQPESISQLHSFYAIVQSQFLTRLALSMAPNLVEKCDDNLLRTVHRIVVRVVYKLDDSIHKLKKRFRPVFINGIYYDGPKSARRLTKKPERSNPSIEMFARNIHDLSNSLQFSLIKSRELEISLHKENGYSENIDKEMAVLQDELNSCQAYIAALQILNRKHGNSPPEILNDNHEGEPWMTNDEPITTDIGYSDLDPLVEDDIFVATTDGFPDYNESAFDEEECIDPATTIRHKLMMNELNTRLKHQADEWAKREAKVMSRKGLDAPEIFPSLLAEYNGESDNEYEYELAPKVKMHPDKLKNSMPRRRKLPTQTTKRKYQFDQNFVPPEGAAMFAEAMKQHRIALPISEESFSESFVSGPTEFEDCLENTQGERQ